MYEQPLSISEKPMDATTAMLAIDGLSEAVRGELLKLREKGGTRKEAEEVLHQLITERLEQYPQLFSSKP